VGALSIYFEPCPILDRQNALPEEYWMTCKRRPQRHPIAPYTQHREAPETNPNLPQPFWRLWTRNSVMARRRRHARPSTVW
jgi:hypothetical protein